MINHIYPFNKNELQTYLELMSGDNTKISNILLTNNSNLGYFLYCVFIAKNWTLGSDELMNSLLSKQSLASILTNYDLKIAISNVDNIYNYFYNAIGNQWFNYKIGLPIVSDSDFTYTASTISTGGSANYNPDTKEFYGNTGSNTNGGRLRISVSYPSGITQPLRLYTQFIGGFDYTVNVTQCSSSAATRIEAYNITTPQQGTTILNSSGINTFTGTYNELISEIVCYGVSQMQKGTYSIILHNFYIKE